jgi:ABC-type transport system involved in multi-copper enzyme maturation permease subunit
MKAIWTISTLTLQEAIRNKILYLLLFFSLFIIFASWIVGQLTIGDEVKIIKDMGLSSIHFFGVLITILIGINLIFREMEKRTIYLILSKPVKRYQFLLGKFMGLAMILLLVLIALGILFYVVLILKGDRSPRLGLAFAFIYLEWLIIAGIAILFSSFSTPLLSVMLTLAAFFMGHLTDSLLMLRDRLSSGAGNTILTGLFYFLPNLEMFNVRTQLVHNIPVPWNYFLEAGIYGVLYLSALLLIAIQIFHKRDFV